MSPTSPYHSAAAVKRPFRMKDFRVTHLILSFIPLLLFVAGIAIGAIYWSTPWGIAVACLALFLGYILAGKSLDIMYSTAIRALPEPIRGIPGVDFLLFDSEPPETVHKLKVLPEDAGFIHAENGCYRVLTLHHDLRIPFKDFHHEILQVGGATKAVLLRFPSPEGKESMEIAASFKYVGKDIGIAGDYHIKAEWASSVLEGMKDSA